MFICGATIAMKIKRWHHINTSWLRWFSLDHNNIIRHAPHSVADWDVFSITTVNHRLELLCFAYLWTIIVAWATHHRHYHINDFSCSRKRKKSARWLFRRFEVKMQVILFRFVVHLSELHERVESHIWRNVSRCQTAIAPIKNGLKETESSLYPLSKHVPWRRARIRETEFKLNLCK